jgi:hypothetical protein
MSFTNAGPSTTSTSVQLGQGGAADGKVIGDASTSLVGFWGTTPVAQPSGASQTALTDSSGGTANAATGVSANAQKQSVIIPIPALSGLANSQVWKIAIPFAFSVTSALIRAGVPVTTGSKAATLTVQINGTPVTGGVISATSAGLGTTGATQAATAITGANTGTAGQTLEVAVSSVTAFVEGTAQVEFTIVDTDLANQTASMVQLTNALRSALVTAGLIKGAA